MNKNFLRIACANINLHLLNVKKNTLEIINYIDYAKKFDVDLIQFSELTLTGISAGDLITQNDVLDDVENSLLEILKHSSNTNFLISLGMPLRANSGIYNCLVIIKNGEILGILAKSTNSTYTRKLDNFKFEDNISLSNVSYRVSNELIFKYKNLKIGFGFEDDYIKEYSSINSYIANGVKILSIAGSSEELSNSDDLLKDLSTRSKRNSIAIAYAGASCGESSTSYVYSAKRIIVENGYILENSRNFKNGISYNDININELNPKNYQNKKYEFIHFELENKSYPLKRILNKTPFIPSTKNDYNKKMENILNIQSEALKRRLSSLSIKKVFIGISGGLDSTLALIISSLTFYKLGIDSKNIYAIIMPGLGTSSRTLENAKKLANLYNTTIMEIDITKSVLQHFDDISHDHDDYSITYENAQARERTQILMDLSNKFGGIVLGTGNMSEIALGWSTYNGDHMSMYGINAAIPKTLLREVVRYVSENSHSSISETLKDIIGTPISPELLPTKNGEISQKTENNIGPYEVHDFFIYHYLKNNSKYDETYFMAKNTFFEKYTEEELKKWLDKFIFRLKAQQFKRNCSPDYPKIEEFSLNSKLDFILASDLDIDALK